MLRERMNVGIADLFTRGDADIVHAPRASRHSSPFSKSSTVCSDAATACFARAGNRRHREIKRRLALVLRHSAGGVIHRSGRRRRAAACHGDSPSASVAPARSWRFTARASIGFSRQGRAESAATNIERASPFVDESIKSSPTEDDEETAR